MSGDGSEEVGLIDVIERAEELVKVRIITFRSSREVFVGLPMKSSLIGANEGQ